MSIAVTVLAAIAVVLVVRVAYHQLHLTALRGWLRRPQLETLPRGRGVWEEALAELHRFLKRRDAEQEGLDQSLARFRAAVRALPDGVVILDREHRIEWANPTAAHHFGIDARRDLGQPVVNLIRQPDFVTFLGAGDFSQPLALRARDATLSLRVIASVWAVIRLPSSAMRRRSGIASETMPESSTIASPIRSATGSKMRTS